MGLTLTKVSRNQAGQRREALYDFVFDSSYPTGGEALTAAQLGLKQIETLEVVESPDGYFFDYDRANSKLKAFYVDNNNASDGPIIQVPDTTDLSAVNGRLRARGY